MSSICTACAKISPATRLLRLHPDVSSLRESALFCPLCYMILGALERADLIKKAEEYRAHKDGDEDSAYVLVNDTSVTVSINGHDARADEKAWTLIISCGPMKRERFMRQTEYYKAPATWLNIYAEEGSAAAEAVMTRPLTNNASSEGALRLMEKWIKTCVDDHHKCQWGYSRKELDLAGPSEQEGARLKAKYSEDKIELPTRVIDVQAFEDGVKLVESSSVGGKGCFTALSHCWGKIKHFKTEHATYDQRKTKICIHELPKTFRDAVEITRKLGIRYLWIDSICIVQDSTEDWAYEASRMASVYMNAYVTLSATFAVDGNGGLFAARVPPPSSVSLKYIDHLTGAQDGIWTIHNRNSNWSEHVRRSVLASRAWTLQEKELARRTLHFASDQVSFECHESIEFETQRPGVGTKARSVSFQYLYWTILGIRDNATATAILIPYLVNSRWCRIIEDYTTRKLTVESDKLPALEGLANYIAELTEDRYCFGLWRASLEIGLMWRSAPYADADERRGRVRGRAPTWSWASMDGRIYFAEFGTEILEAHTTNAIDIIDVGTDGTLTVSGRLISLHRGKLGLQGPWDWNQMVKFYNRMETIDVKTNMARYEPVRSQDQQWFGFAALDDNVDVEDLQQQEVTALFMRQMTRKDIDTAKLSADQFKDSYQVLFLRKTDAEQTYERIGMGQVFLCDGSEDMEKKTLYIV
ncbi:HET-domain-containing protein [Paraphaeosphaeria sporulosa]|uniref:HET-domain-containing protein n=1 Tax=Paraphaeosphaeria sporulosa TaxID=1460663 RepID=A0A177CAA9_9PLEO|nr:HET-domain-containing protein [Paraphaeosphaeria sporulosa]OAG03660.1 HET-domain-containing protein [Paraphaeosphaeria sporulosa]